MDPNLVPALIREAELQIDEQDYAKAMAALLPLRMSRRDRRACRAALVHEASIGRLSVKELNERVDRLRVETTYADLEQIFTGLADAPPFLRLRASRIRGSATFDLPVVMMIGGAILVFTVWFMIAVHTLLSTAVGLAILAATGFWIAVTYRKAHPRDRGQKR